MTRTAHFAPSAAPVRASSSSVSALLGRLAMWLAVVGERRALSRMSDDRLADMGLTRGAAQREASRPFWDAPCRAR